MISKDSPRISGGSGAAVPGRLGGFWGSGPEFKIYMFTSFQNPATLGASPSRGISPLQNRDEDGSGGEVCLDRVPEGSLAALLAPYWRPIGAL